MSSDQTHSDPLRQGSSSPPPMEDKQFENRRTKWYKHLRETNGYRERENISKISATEEAHSASAGLVFSMSRDDVDQQQ